MNSKTQILNKFHKTLFWAKQVHKSQKCYLIKGLNGLFAQKSNFHIMEIWNEVFCNLFNMLVIDPTPNQCWIGIHSFLKMCKFPCFIYEKDQNFKSYQNIFSLLHDPISIVNYNFIYNIIYIVPHFHVIKDYWNFILLHMKNSNILLKFSNYTFKKWWMVLFFLVWLFISYSSICFY